MFININVVTRASQEPRLIIPIGAMNGLVFTHLVLHDEFKEHSLYEYQNWMVSSFFSKHSLKKNF